FTVEGDDEFDGAQADLAAVNGDQDLHLGESRCSSGGKYSGEPATGGLLLDEGPLENVFARHPDARRRGEAAAVEQGAEVGKHGGAAADHGAVVLRIQGLQAQDLHHPPAVHVGGQAAAVVVAVELEGLA